MSTQYFQRMKEITEIFERINEKLKERFLDEIILKGPFHGSYYESHVVGKEKHPCTIGYFYFNHAWDNPVYGPMDLKGNIGKILICEICNYKKIEVINPNIFLEMEGLTEENVKKARKYQELPNDLETLTEKVLEFVRENFNFKFK